MEKKFKFCVQQYERGKWVTKVESIDLDFAVEQAHQRSVVTKERVRVVRVDECVIVKFM